jgi:signal transduction histidine kinase
MQASGFLATSMPAPRAASSLPVAAPTHTRLGDFLRSHATEILEAWDEFAATVNHDGKPLDAVNLRDHAAEILLTIANDLAQPQSSEQQDAKGKGLGPRSCYPTPAETHADFRMVAGFAVDAMITEYRALRASVLKIWAKDGGGTAPEDLTDLTRFNEAIDQSIAESVARYTRQTRSASDLFIGVLGHDIRNPLGTIMMSGEYLVRSGQLSKGAAAPIMNAAVRIKAIIEQVVDFTRAQADGEMPILRVPGNLADQLAKIVEETQVRHPTRTVRFEFTGDFEGSWDEGRMGQLLSNLLGNALIYGARESEVAVRMWDSGNQVSFSVHNEGQPIPPAEQERIFQPLERGLHQQLTGEQREPTGLGLGLYICREIVLAHGGTLQVESREGAGTTFIVSLPRTAP